VNLFGEGNERPEERKNQQNGRPERDSGQSGRVKDKKKKKKSRTQRRWGELSWENGLRRSEEKRQEGERVKGK